MAKADTSNRSPRGAKPVSRAFLTAIEEIPDAMRPTVAKAALAMIRDELKTRKERARIVAARAKMRAASQVRSAKVAEAAKAPARAAADNDRLPLAESEHVPGWARLVGQLQAIVKESGDPEGFDARAWLLRWLGEPLPALGGVRPLDMLDTIEGQGLVSASLARIQASAYA